MKRRWKLWVGLLLSAGALVLALTGIDLRQVAETLAQAEYVYLLPATVGFFAYLVARSARLRLLLGAQVGLSRCFWSTCVGYLVSNVLPFRLGDAARAVAVALGGRVKASGALSSIIVENVLDMLMVVSLLAASLPFVREVGLLRHFGLLAGVAALIASAVLVVLARWPAGARRAARWLMERVARLGEERWLGVLDDVLSGLAPLRSTRQVLTLLVWSCMAWGFVVAYYYALLLAFLDRPTLVQGSLLVCAVGLAMALPAAPGAVGLFHTVALYALVWPFDVPEDPARVVAFATHAFQYVLVCALGLVGLLHLGLSLKQLRVDAAAVLSHD